MAGDQGRPRHRGEAAGLGPVGRASVPTSSEATRSPDQGADSAGRLRTVPPRHRPRPSSDRPVRSGPVRDRIGPGLSRARGSAARPVRPLPECMDPGCWALSPCMFLTPSRPRKSESPDPFIRPSGTFSPAGRSALRRGRCGRRRRRPVALTPRTGERDGVSGFFRNAHGERVRGPRASTRPDSGLTSTPPDMMRRAAQDGCLNARSPDGQLPIAGSAPRPMQARYARHREGRRPAVHPLDRTKSSAP